MATIHIQSIGEKVLLPQSELERLVELHREEIVLDSREDDASTGRIMHLVAQSGAFDFWKEEGDCQHRFVEMGTIYTHCDYEYLAPKCRYRQTRGRTTQKQVWC